MKRIRVLKPFRYLEGSPEKYRAITLYYGTHKVTEAHAAYGIEREAAVEVALNIYTPANPTGAQDHWRESTRLPGGRAALQAAVPAND